MTDQPDLSLSSASSGERAASKPQPAPLEGCLYCHTPQSTTLGESKPMLGFGGGGQMVTCSACGAVALFEPGATVDEWRINYRKFNRAPRFYYVMVHLGQAGWLSADEALEASRKGFVQRHRLTQAMKGELGWLHPAKLEHPPSLMSPAKAVYMTFNPTTLFQGARGSRTAQILSRGEGSVQDTGKFYVTDLKLHLLGKQRDWSHKLADIQRVEHTDKHWRIYVGESSLYYQGEVLPEQIDPQLFAAVVKALVAKD